MEADWSVEIGSGFPEIDGAWSGFVDLRLSLSTVDSLEEARNHPALREALLRLNAEESPIFTTKCDAWPLTSGEVDPDEFAATNITSNIGFASYIDVIERDPFRFASFALQESRARAIADVLRVNDLRQSRVDLVLRQAHLRENSGFGLTLYVAGCGANISEAETAWQAALEAAVAATIARDAGE